MSDEREPRRYPESLERGVAALLARQPTLEADGVARVGRRRPERDRVEATVSEYVERAEKSLDRRLGLVPGVGLYPYDALVLGEALGLRRAERERVATALVFHYQALHLVDDALDDDAKFRAKFAGTVPAVADLLAVFEEAHRQFAADTLGDADAARVCSAFRERSLASARALAEDGPDGPPRSVEAMVERDVYGVTGVMYGLLGDLVRTARPVADPAALDRALADLGAACHLSDDLRDVREDFENGDRNVALELLATEGTAEDAAERASERWRELFDGCLARSERAFRTAGLPVEATVLRTVALYPAARADLR